MLEGKMNALFSPKLRKLLLIISFLCGFVCLLFLRYSHYKTVMLYAAIVCFMHLIVFYKNSLNKYETGIFCFLCVQLFAVAPKPSQMEDIVSTSYLLSYRYGVSSRSLIATIVDFFTNGAFISKYFIWHFILCVTVFLSFIISVYLGEVIRKAKDDIKIFLVFLSLLYLSCFTSPTAYFIPANYGRIEIFAFLFMLLLIVIIDKPIIRWLIPLLALFTFATHLILVFFYIPFIIIMLLYALSTKTERIKRTVLLLVVTIIILSLSFLLYLLFHEKTFAFEDAHEFFEYLIVKSDLNFSEDRLHMLMFAELQEHLNGWKNRMGFNFSGNFSIIINIPLMLLCIFFWIRCYFMESKKIMKYFFLLPVIVLPYQFLAFLMFFDFGRWMIMILNVQFMLIFYLAFKRNKTVISAAQITIPFIKRNGFFILLIFLIMIFLGPVGYIGPGDRTLRFFKCLIQLIGYLTPT
ncbi:MAG: hypothetical protein LBB89_12255 [Treponema sp.]|jgi:4-amino-4-deoxy-L-arabinose transferase-like glycosyltransferase|nr:hypothetical protein [Treponema sp.]